MFIILKPYLLSFWLSMLPVTELRATVPWIMLTYGDHWFGLVVVAIIGNIIPAIFILWGLSYIDRIILKKRNIVSKLYDKVIQRTRRKTQLKISTYGYIALLLFVAIPLPGTGAWTGSVAAWLFGLSRSRSLLVISFGVILAAVIMVLISKGLILSF